MKLFLHGSNRQDTLVRVFQMKSRLFRLHHARLHQNNTGDDLQAIGNSMLQFLKQCLFLSQQLVLLSQQPVLFALQDALLGECSGRFRGQSGHEDLGWSRQLMMLWTAPPRGIELL